MDSITLFASNEFVIFLFIYHHLPLLILRIYAMNNSKYLQVGFNIESHHVYEPTFISYHSITYLLD